jgi:hypothetical protein
MLVALAMAEITTTGCSGARDRTIFATFLIAGASWVDVPPNFITIMCTGLP